MTDTHDTRHQPIASCRQCDADRHICPGCGDGITHGEFACIVCRAETAAEPERLAAMTNDELGDTAWNVEESQTRRRAAMRELSRRQGLR